MAKFQTDQYEDESVTDAKRPRLLAASVYRDTDLTVGNAAWTEIAFPSEDFDPEAWHDTVTNNGRVTVGEAGLYHLKGHARFDHSTTGARLLRFQKNAGDVGPTGGPDYANYRASSNYVHSVEFSMYAILAANDYITLETFQNTGGNLDCSGAWLQVVKVSD